MWELCSAHSGGTLLITKHFGILGEAGAWRHGALVPTWPRTDRREGSQQVSEPQDPQPRSDCIHQVSPLPFPPLLIWGKNKPTYFCYFKT